MYISTLRTKYKRNRELIQAMLELSPAAYNTMQYERGIAYLQTILDGDTDSFNILSASADYWTWWINQWNLADRKWLDDVLDRTFLPGFAQLIPEYLAIHRVEWDNHIYPNNTLIRRILQKSRP